MHEPVLLPEIITALRCQPDAVYIDGTVGAGGHAAAILTDSAPDGQLFALDQDDMALAIAQSQLAKFGQRVTLWQANFDQLAQIAQRHHLPLVDGILLDLGVSSMQIEQPERGFSFQADGFLDMRMDLTAGQTAADLVNHLSEIELAALIYRYGEERQSRRIAKAIVKSRPIFRTVSLAEVVTKAKVPSTQSNHRKIHPATQTFQALRIAVNDELGALERVLPQTLKLLKSGGRLAIISFHSLEDRIVKRFFQQESKDCICSSEQPICTCSHQATIQIITKKPITASSAEITKNPRSRSAKLRVIERVA